MQKQISKKGNSGITLIALVITIIVLLILAGIVIASLTGENGILNRAADAREDSKRAELIELVHVDLIESQTDPSHYGQVPSNEIMTILGKYFTADSLEAVQEGRLTDKTYIESTYVTAQDKYEVKDGILLSELLNGTSVALTDEAKAAKAESDRQTFITAVRTAITAKAEEDGTVTPESVTEVLTSYFTADSITAISSFDLTNLTDVQKATTMTATEANGGYEVILNEMLDGILVKNAISISPEIILPENKTALTVGRGDTIIMGGEQFMVLANDGTMITAMPYYNITLDLENPKQSSAAGSIAFSSSQFWAYKNNIEPMSKSNIQQYITAYQVKLQEIVGSSVEAVAGRNSGDVANGDIALTDFRGIKNSENKLLLNPSGVGSFWLGTYSWNVNFPVTYVNTSGTMAGGKFDNSSGPGVRPVIKITLR